MMNLEKNINYQFTDPGLLTQALTHKSYLQTEGGKDNEVLELLGDSVLGLAVVEVLMQRFPNDREGNLSRKRAGLVNSETLAQIALEIGLEKFLRLGKGEERSGGSNKPRLLASALEAVVGALFLDGGLDPARQFIASIFSQRMEDLAGQAAANETDYKTRLQELVQRRRLPVPTYQVLSSHGPDHDKMFSVVVEVQQEPMGRGDGRTKKAAEQAAARQALEVLQNSDEKGK